MMKGLLFYSFFMLLLVAIVGADTYWNNQNSLLAFCSASCVYNGTLGKNGTDGVNGTAGLNGTVDYSLVYNKTTIDDLFSNQSSWTIGYNNTAWVVAQGYQTEAQCRAIASEFNETLLAGGYLNYHYINDTTLPPYTNRTDAEIRSIASEFNETLWVIAQAYLTSSSDYYNSTSLPPYTNRTDAEIRTIASEFNETLWVQSFHFINITYNETAWVVAQSYLTVASLPPYTNRTDAEIRAIASEFNETLLAGGYINYHYINDTTLPPYTNRTDAEIRNIAKEFNETLWVQTFHYVNVTYNETPWVVAQNYITVTYNETAWVIAQGFAKNATLPTYTNLTKLDIINFDFLNRSISNATFGDWKGDKPSYIANVTSSNLQISGTINQTIVGQTRYFSNGCYETSNATGIYVIC